MDCSTEDAIGRKRRWRWIIRRRNFFHLGEFDIEKAKPHPAGGAVGLAVVNDGFRQLTVDFRKPQLLPAGEDRICQVLPEHRQEGPHSAILLTLIDHWKVDSQYIVTPTCQPIDLFNVGFEHRHNRFSHQFKSRGEKFFQLSSVGEETDRDGHTLALVLFKCKHFPTRTLSWSRHGTKMSGHHVHQFGIEWIRHFILLFLIG